MQSITHKSPSEVCARRRLFLLASPPLNGRRASSCLAVAGRLGARSPLTVPAPALAPRRRARPSSLPAGRRPESPHLRARCSGGADLERARGGRRGGACAAARARTGAGSRLAAWPARPFKFLSHSAAAQRAQSADRHVARGRSASPRRRSWPPARAQRPRHSRSASRRRSASERANSHCAARYTREPKSRLEMTYVAAAHPHARVAARLRTAPAGLEPTTKTSPTRTLHQLGHTAGSICNTHKTGRS